MTIGTSALDAPSPPNGNISSATPTSAKKRRAPAKPRAKKAKKVTAPGTPVTPNGYAPADASSYGEYSVDSKTAQRAINYDFDLPDTIEAGSDDEAF